MNNPIIAISNHLRQEQCKLDYNPTSIRNAVSEHIATHTHHYARQTPQQVMYIFDLLLTDDFHIFHNGLNDSVNLYNELNEEWLFPNGEGQFSIIELWSSLMEEFVN